MFGQVIIEAGSEGIAESPHLRIEPAIFFAGQARNLERVVKAILVQALLAVQLGSSAQSENEILFDAPEIILGLRVGKTKDSARVGLAKDMRNTIGVAINGHRLGQPVSVN